jgi:pyruvate,water dikinase
MPSSEGNLAISVFYGRPALNVNFICEMGDRMPGPGGRAIADQVFSSVPDDFISVRRRRYYPRVALRLPVTAVATPVKARAIRSATEEWWQDRLRALAVADLDEALVIFDEACSRYEYVVWHHVQLAFAVVQPVYDQLSALLRHAPEAKSVLQAGHGGHEESALISDLWACSRGQVSLAEFLDKHGYQGPRGGELSAVVWREDPEPLESILAHYRTLSDDRDPARSAAALASARKRAETELLASLPLRKRPLARLVLQLAERCIPLRSVGKVSYLQCFDVIRAAARQIGRILAAERVIDLPDDVFYLTAEELLDRSWSNAHDRIAARRRQRDAHLALTIPTQWVGVPESLVASEGVDDAGMIEGQGVSAGVVVGRVRVVSEPGETEMEDHEILVGHVTDPSWTSVMFLSAALVTDVGAQFSHTAVVARELGIPCVVDTQIATKVLRTGDLCRVDGTKGTIEILERATRSSLPAS